jgi:NADH-quinone oxidoreductase subunit H
LMAWAVIPFSAEMVLADINVGLLYILAISSLGVYGVVVSGWASNSKYPFFSAMRAAAQMISYEVSIGFVLICVVLWAGSFNLNAIIEAQRGHGFGLVNGFFFNLLLFPMWVVFLISSLAETARAPFDLTEAESELVAGYQTEYSSMSFALFWLGEYANVLLMCALNAILFFGGWLPPLNVDLIPWFDIPGIIWLLLKIFFFFFVFSWIKATVPRYRYDQLMRLGWKVFLPLSLGFVVLVSGYLMLTRFGPEQRADEVSLFGAPVGTAMQTVYTCEGGGRGGLVFVREWRVETDSLDSWFVQEAGLPKIAASEVMATRPPGNGPWGPTVSWLSATGDLVEASMPSGDVVDSPFGPSSSGFVVRVGDDSQMSLGVCSITYRPATNGTNGA